MKPNEYIIEMFTRFTDVFNKLEGLGNRENEEDKVFKILRCLPFKWNSKTEAIMEANNLRELPLEKLIGSLMAYEMKIKRQENEIQEEEDKKKNITLKVQEKKVVEETKINDMKDDITLITKRVQKLMMKDKFSGRTYNRRSNYMKEGLLREEKEKRERAREVICYNCKKSGHINYGCPLYKSKREKRRAMMATWNQSKDSFDDENEKEVANMCFMALEDQDEVNSNFDDDEFMIEYEELLKDINKLDEKNTSLKNKELDEIKEIFSKVEA